VDFVVTVRHGEAPDLALVSLQQNEEVKRLSEVGIQQNDEVKEVSAWAAILFAPTLIGTVYGMNFDQMPELHWEFGYQFALSLMALGACCSKCSSRGAAGSEECHGTTATPTEKGLKPWILPFRPSRR
jgi:hypothetical protein